jgi:hypothetical protein
MINEDEMIVEPVVDDWASEGQILDITVAAMYDDVGNKQSPITWTAGKTK